MQGDDPRGDERALTKREITTLERRRHIVETAAICFVEQGFHQTSIRDIAKRAGISLGNLYNHFETKTALIAEIATLESEDLQDMQSALAADGDPGAILDRFIADYFAYVARAENAVLAAEITAEAMRSPQIVGPYLDNRRTLIGALAAILRRMPEGATPPCPADPVQLAETLLDVIGAAASRVAFEDAATQETTCATTRQVAARLLGN